MKLPRLREVRESHGWSQGALAEKAGVSRDSISNYETGQREAWPSTAKRLADALDVEITDLRGVGELVGAGKDEAPASGPSLLEKALDAVRQDETKEAQAMARLGASEGILETTAVSEYEEDKFRAELRTRGFPDDYFESFIWPLVVKARQAEVESRRAAHLQEELAQTRGELATLQEGQRAYQE